MFISLVDLLLIVSCFSYLLIGSFLIIKNRQNQSNILLASISISSALWTGGIVLFRIIPFNTNILFSLNLLFIVSSGVIASSFFNFSLIFTQTIKKMSLSKTFLIHLPNLIIFLFGLVPGVLISEIFQRSWGRESILGWGYIYFGSYIAFYYLAGIFLLTQSYLKARGHFRNQLFYIIAATMLTGAIDIYFNLILILAGNYQYIWIGPYSSFIWVSVLAYAITKTRLMDISVIISKSFAYGMTMIILGIGYLFFVIPYRLYISSDISIGFISCSIAYGIFVGFAFERLRMFIQTSSDKVFLKGKYDFKNTMSYFVNRLFKVVSLDEFEGIFEKARLEIVESKILKVILLDNSRDPKELPDEIIDILSNNRNIEFMSDVKHKLKDVEFLVPCFSGKSLMAVLVVGKKLSEDPYKDDEIDVFRILAPQIATVIERVKPYEQVKTDLVSEQEKVKIAQKAAEDNARLAALGTLAAGLAHEIRNPMTVIRSKSETVIEKIDDKDYVLKFAKLVPEQIDRILGIVNRMLKFARTAQEELIQCDPNKILQDTAALLDGKIKDKNLKLSFSLGAKSRIMANPVTLSEAVFNIILNSIDFTPSGGEISLSSADPDGKVVIEIKDSGEGISADKIEQIFDPFFTTRAEGTGLGLSIAYRTIREHKGSITAASTPGAGALFTIILPACQ